jgi:hypothetical protein
MQSRLSRSARPALLAAAVLATAVLVILGAVGEGRGQGAAPVDLELVLAVDASSSVSASEFNLQMHGLAEAFRHPAVQGAIRGLGDLGIAVAMVQWSDNRKQTVAIEWTVVRDEAEAVAFAGKIDNTPRYLIGGGTAIGGALIFATHQLQVNRFEGRRKVIDLSGDGRTNQGSSPAKARDEAVALGITVNGLAILNEDQLVDRHYANHVIGGTGAFVMRANDYENFADAILEKLIKEIGGAPIARLPAADDAASGGPS